jgi:TetR/AcrR family transcriptional regulator
MTRWSNTGADVRKRHELKRETLLVAAARCFNKLGYHGTTLDDIARELNVTKAALYYYIDGKDQIYYQCNEAAVGIALKGVALAEASPGSAADKLRMALRSYIEAAADTRTAPVVLYERGSLPPRLHRRLAEKRDTYEQRLRQLIADGIADGVFMPCDPKIVVFGMLGAISWISKWFSPDGARTPTEVGAILSEYLVRGIEAPEASAGTGSTASRRGNSVSHERSAK